MTGHVVEQAISEQEFAALVDHLSGDPGPRDELVGLLREGNPVYDQRGTSATVRMRGWVLLALERHGLPDTALLYALEELDTGRDPYLVAAAARVLRSRSRPEPAFAAYLARAITNVRHHDDFVSFASYGAYAGDEDATTALGELFTTLRWMGPVARGAVPDLRALVEEHRRGELPASLLAEVTRTLGAILEDSGERQTEQECCTLPWGASRTLHASESRSPSTALASTVFEDHLGNRLGFSELFRGKPSVLVFFYTRCDNPRKCSLSIAKLGRLQRLIAERGIAGQVRTAAITYDPGWDLPERLRGYAQSRNVRLDDDNRMLRCTPEALTAIRAHFGLGVNYIESLVNRHRVEAFVLDTGGRVAVTFERLQWEEREVADRLEEILAETQRSSEPGHRGPTPRAVGSLRILPTIAPLVSLAAAFFPKCPVCWAAYLSFFGIAGLERVAYAPWLLPALLGVMAINLGSLWLRSRSSGRMLAFTLGSAGAFAIAVLGMFLGVGWSRPVGVALTLGASMLSVADTRLGAASQGRGVV